MWMYGEQGRWRGGDGGGSVCVKGKEGRRDSPRGSAGVHVAGDRLLIQRKYTACPAAVLHRRKEDSGAFIILIRMI